MFQSQTRSRSTCDPESQEYQGIIRLFQSQTRSRSTCDNALCRLWRVIATFQSQTRSRSTCDDGKPAYYWVPCCRFNLRREAAPHATHTDVNNALTFAAVSISDEKPL